VREPTHDPLGEDIGARQRQGTGTVGEEGSEHTSGTISEECLKKDGEMEVLGCWIMVMPRQGGSNHTNL